MSEQHEGQGANRTHELGDVPDGWKRRLSLLALSFVMIQSVLMTHVDVFQTLAMAEDSIKALPSGQITAKREAEIEIDHKTYSLQPNMVVQDEEGRPIDFGALRVGTRISFHVRNGRIDQIVVALAR